MNENYPVELFTEVAPKYELFNTVLTAGQDKNWRLAALEAATRGLEHRPEQILDLATGTGDFPRLMMRKWPNAQITGTDPNERMLEYAQKTVQKLKKKFPPLQKIDWKAGYAQEIHMEDNSVDLVTIGFGYRNVPTEKRDAVMQEVYRVLKPGGVFVILELGMPEKGAKRSIYSFLLGSAMPKFIGMFAEKKPYEYLANSIREFPTPQKVIAQYKNHGFIPFAPKALSLGICWLFMGKKPQQTS